MAKIDADSDTLASSSNPNPNPSLINGDRPPQLKKFRTLSVGDTTPSPVFAGPLRPAVRRLTVSVDDPSDAPSVGGLLDRDWCYPSFLGGGNFPSRPRAAVKSTRPPPPPPPAAALAGKRMEFSSFSDGRRPPNRANEEARKVEEKDERDHQVVSASQNDQRVRPSRIFNNSLILSVVSRKDLFLFCLEITTS